MKTPPASIEETRQALELLRDFGIPESTLRRAAIKAAREFGVKISAGIRHESVACFIDRWNDDRLPIPRICCLSSDLYQAYLIWCSRERIEQPATLTAFGRELVELNIPKIHSRQGKVLDPSGTIGGALKQSIDEFRKALKAYGRSRRGGRTNDE